MSSGLKQKWETLRPETRMRATIGLVAGAFVIVLSLIFVMTGNKDKKPVNIAEPKKTITLDPKLLEKTMTVKTDDTAYKVEKLQKQLEAMQKGGGVVPSGPAGLQDPNSPVNMPNAGKNSPVLPGVPAVAGNTPDMSVNTGTGLQKPNKKRGGTAPPPLPPGFPPQGGGNQNNFGTLPPPPGANGDVVVAAPQREIIGDIEIVANPGYKAASTTASNGTPGAATADGDKKKAELDIYLPPSYVEATLLNGLYAPTSEGARGNPVPVLLRVRDLAQLPNDVRANIKGCFVISDGVGNLSDERAHLRLKSLSCISKKGESVIDQPVKGFVVDSDGKLGISGTVVSKMGATITRSLIAGFFSGFGDALKQSSQYSSQTTGILGTTSVLTADLSQMALAGVGQGVSNAANDLGKFYLELAKQTMPVVEVGAAKRVTLVFSEGVTLKVKEFKRAKLKKTKG